MKLLVMVIDDDVKPVCLPAVLFLQVVFKQRSRKNRHTDIFAQKNTVSEKDRSEFIEEKPSRTFVSLKYKL
jgi:hypothetical protein